MTVSEAGIRDIVVVERRARSAHPYTSENGYMMLSLNGVSELSERMKDRSLGMQAVRVLFAMVESCDFENHVRAGQKDLAQRLEMDPRDVSKAVKALSTCGFVERSQVWRGYYRINPRLMWKGSAKNLKAALAVEHHAS